MADESVVAAVSAAMRLPGVTKPPVQVGGRWFWIERQDGASDDEVLIVEEDGLRRALLDPIRHNSAPGPSRGGWVVGPRGADGEQYVVVDDYGEEASDAATAGLVIDVRTGDVVRRIEPRVMGVGFRSPDRIVYEKKQIDPDTGVQRIPLREHDIATGDDKRFTTAGVDYDDNSAHGFVHSADGRWLVITEAADLFGLGNRVYLHDLHGGHTYVHGADRAAMVHPYFGTDGGLLLEVDGEIRRIDLDDASPDAVRAALADPEVLMAAEADTLVQTIQPFAVDGRQVLAVSRQVKGAYSELLILDPAAEAPQKVDLVSQVRAWPMLDGAGDTVVGPQGGILDLGMGREGRPVLTFAGLLNPAESYALTYHSPSEPAVLERQTENGEEFARRMQVPELRARLWATTAPDGTRVWNHTVARVDAEQDTQPRLATLNVYSNFNTVVARDHDSVPARREAAVVLGGGTAIRTATRGSGELGGEHFRAGHKWNDKYQVMDVVAVAEDAFARGLTTPDLLVTHGGSGSGPMLLRLPAERPDIFRNVFGQNISAGIDPDRHPRKARQHNRTFAYGDPDDPADRARLKEADPENQLRRRLRLGSRFSLALVQGTNDDRVLPEAVDAMADIVREARDQGVITGVFTYTKVSAGHSIGTAPSTARTAAESAFVSFVTQTTGWDPTKGMRDALHAAAVRSNTRHMSAAVTRGLSPLRTYGVNA